MVLFGRPIEQDFQRVMDLVSGCTEVRLKISSSVTNELITTTHIIPSLRVQLAKLWLTDRISPLKLNISQTMLFILNFNHNKIVYSLFFTSHVMVSRC